jgi:hypothetical protein
MFLILSEYDGDEKSDQAPPSFSESEYSVMLEKRLSDILEKMEGVSDVTVMITLEGGVSYEYAKKLFRVLERTGDISVFAKEMQKAVRLITSVQKSVDKDMAKRLKDGDTDGFISLVFERFTKENWSDFSAVTSVNINKEEYNKAATEFYGKEFTDYVGGLTAYDLQDLKNAVGKEDFTKVLKGYLSWGFPAFTYGEDL